MNFQLTNTSSDTNISNIRVTSATATNGVKVDDLLPKPLGALGPGEMLNFILKWQVPQGVKNFVTDISICADCEELCIDCDPEPVCEGPGCNPPIEEEQTPPVEEQEEQKATVIHASALPNTGFSMVTPVIFGLGLLLLGGLMPVAKKAYRRNR
jgi:LPXTG-motif cell wall-anchored protein